LGESDEIGSIISPFLFDLAGKEGFVHGLWVDLAGFRRFWGHDGERKWGFLVLEWGIGLLDVLKTGFCDIVLIFRWNHSFCCDIPILITDHHVSNSFLFPDYTGGVVVWDDRVLNTPLRSDPRRS